MCFSFGKFLISGKGLGFSQKKHPKKHDIENTKKMQNICKKENAMQISFSAFFVQISQKPFRKIIIFVTFGTCSIRKTRHDKKHFPTAPAPRARCSALEHRSGAFPQKLFSSHSLSPLNNHPCPVWEFLRHRSRGSPSALFGKHAGDLRLLLVQVFVSVLCRAVLHWQHCLRVPHRSQIGQTNTEATDLA